MKHLIVKCGVCIVVLLVLYEASFRIVTGLLGEVDTDSRPVTLYYRSVFSVSGDKSARFLEIIFYPRIKIPLGMTRLARGTGAYVRGGDIYSKPANKWVNMTIFFEKNISVRSNNAFRGITYGEGISPAKE